MKEHIKLIRQPRFAEAYDEGYKGKYICGSERKLKYKSNSKYIINFPQCLYLAKINYYQDDFHTYDFYCRGI